MKYREFGRNGLRASAVGLGCMGMSHTYGATAIKRERRHNWQTTVSTPPCNSRQPSSALRRYWAIC